MVEKGLVVVFSKEGCLIYHENDSQVRGDVTATPANVVDVYKLNQAPEQANVVTAVTSQYEVWHRRLGHLNRKRMNLLQTSIASGINYYGDNTKQCIARIEGKQCWKPFKKGIHSVIITTSITENSYNVIHTIWSSMASSYPSNVCPLPESCIKLQKKKEWLRPSAL
jgi:hypothetical protein